METNHDYAAHIRVIRQKQALLPVIGEKFAKKILEEIFQGDEMIDECEELLVQIYGLHPEDPDKDSPFLDEIVDGVWANTLTKLHDMIRELQNKGVKE